MSDTENAKKTAKETEIYKLFKPPKPIEIALPQFFKDLIVGTVVLLIFFWFGSSFHVLMNGYKTYTSRDFKGVDVNDVPYTCNVPPKPGDDFSSLETSSSAYCANGLETLWGIFPEFIDWYQGTLKDTFSSSRLMLMQLIKQFRGSYPSKEPVSGIKGFGHLMLSGIVSCVSVFGSAVVGILMLLFHSSMNLKNYFYVNNPYVELKDKDGNRMQGASEESIWIGNGNENPFTLAFGLKFAKLHNIVLWAIGLVIQLITVPIYFLFAMLYWITGFAANGSKLFKREAGLPHIWNILYKNGKWIATTWIIMAGIIAYENLGFGGTLSAILVGILHLGLNFFGYVFKEDVDI